MEAPKPNFLQRAKALVEEDDFKARYIITTIGYYVPQELWNEFMATIENFHQLYGEAFYLLPLMVLDFNFALYNNSDIEIRQKMLTDFMENAKYYKDHDKEVKFPFIKKITVNSSYIFKNNIVPFLKSNANHTTRVLVLMSVFTHEATHALISKCGNSLTSQSIIDFSSDCRYMKSKQVNINDNSHIWVGPVDIEKSPDVAENNPLMYAIANGFYEGAAVLLDSFHIDHDLHLYNRNYGTNSFILLAAKNYSDRDAENREFIPPYNRDITIQLMKKMLEIDKAKKLEAEKNGRKYQSIADSQHLKNGNTAAHYAAAHNNIELLKLLFENGADFNIKNNDGKTVGDVLKVSPEYTKNLIDRSAGVHAFHGEFKTKFASEEREKMILCEDRKSLYYQKPALSLQYWEDYNKLKRLQYDSRRIEELTKDMPLVKREAFKAFLNNNKFLDNSQTNWRQSDNITYRQRSHSISSY